MLIWPNVKKLMLRYFTQIKWYTILVMLGVYSLSSWCLLFLAGETELLGLVDFFYWLIVTGSTVGYGDMSPTTDAGKWIVALYVIPTGLSIFALVVGRVASWVGKQWQKGARGMHSLNLKNHVLLIGWNGKRTEQLLRLLLIEREDVPGTPEIVLCVRADIENPMPGDIAFVKVDSFNQDHDMDRACVETASIIIIDNPHDDMTMTTSLYCSQRNPKAHKVSYFDDESLVGLLKQHCPEIECTPSVAVEMLAKSAFDPGSSLLHHDLLDVYEGQAQFSATIPDQVTNVNAGVLFSKLKQEYDATFIGYASSKDRHKIKVNPPSSETLQGEDKIFYIAGKRVNNINWSAIQQA
ncbi:potassium channel protein [Agaribacter flavus]|uniref:Potassium channel family protein n=1 Tax=Agaribacter flavus TaxID=1902781 RepID=A0ABV7FPC3_9ALTE